MLLGIALSFFAVDLFKYLYGLLVTFFNVFKWDILVLELHYLDIAEALAATEGVFLDIPGVHAYLEVHKILTAVESPVANALDSRRDSYGLQRPAP